MPPCQFLIVYAHHSTGSLCLQVSTAQKRYQVGLSKLADTETSVAAMQVGDLGCWLLLCTSLNLAQGLKGFSDMSCACFSSVAVLCACRRS